MKIEAKTRLQASNENPLEDGVAFDTLIDGKPDTETPVVQEVTHDDGGIEKADPDQQLLIDDIAMGGPTGITAEVTNLQRLIAAVLTKAGLTKLAKSIASADGDGVAITKLEITKVVAALKAAGYKVVDNSSSDKTLISYEITKASSAGGLEISFEAGEGSVTFFSGEVAEPKGKYGMFLQTGDEPAASDKLKKTFKNAHDAREVCNRANTIQRKRANSPYKNPEDEKGIYYVHKL